LIFTFGLFGCALGGKTMTDLSFIPQDLLNDLNNRYPERTPEVDWSDRDIWLRAGERRVIRFLNEQFKRQNENILEGPSGPLHRG
jgi:hypothetical protein